MKITIDTKEDNHQEIQKVISLLQNLISGTANSYTNYGNNSDSNNNAPADTSNLMSMFGDTSSTPTKETPDTPADFSGFLNLVNNKNPDKKEPVEIEESSKIEFF